MLYFILGLMSRQLADIRDAQAPHPRPVAPLHERILGAIIFVGSLVLAGIGGLILMVALFALIGALT